MLERMSDALSGGMVQVYDPFVEKDIVPNQWHDLNGFLNSVDMIVIMVGHDEIKGQFERIKDKIVLDTRHIYTGKCYHL